MKGPGKAMLLGNEAIARGLLEGGIQAAAAYPGTPSTEVMETLIKMGHDFGIYTEWSTNEKVAAEVAISASMSGMRAMVSMKGVGINVAAEPFMAYTYMGVEGGLVLVGADDPTPHSSHNEQDNRYFAREAYMPILEPCNVKEALEMARRGLVYSERWGQPVLLRTNTVIGHTRSDVGLRKVGRRKAKGDFVRQPKRWINLPMNARVLRRQMVERMERVRTLAERLPFTRVLGPKDAKVGIITSGISYVYVMEALGILGALDRVKVLKLGMPYPLPVHKVTRFLDDIEKALVVEELEPFVEMQVSTIANKMGCMVPIHGKAFDDDAVPLTGEMTPIRAVRALGRFLELKMPSFLKAVPELEKKAAALAPPRPPVLCPGCPERNGFYAMNIVERRIKKERGEFVRPTDIGCYTIGYMPPLNGADVDLCMGAGIGLSNGFSHFVDRPIIATIGDSTFFHAGMPPLVNAVFNKADVTLLLFDNTTTAMTGHQPHPGMGTRAGGEPTHAIDIEDVVRSFGIDHVEVVGGFDLDGQIRALEEAVRHKGPAVVILRSPCQLLHLRECKAKGMELPVYHIDQDLCRHCKICITRFGCPAMYWKGKDIFIDPSICTGCGACASEEVCRFDAIRSMARGEKEGGS